MTDFDRIRGRELDALVAERIMDMKIAPGQQAPDGGPMALVEVPRYSDDPPHARGILFLFEQRHPGTVMRMDSASPFGCTLVGPSGREYSASDPSEATAICRAMLMAMAGEGPGIPREQIRTSRSARAKAAAAEMLASKAEPHQPIGIIAQAVALQQAEQKLGPARALLAWAASGAGLVPIVAEQAGKTTGDVQRCCVEILAQLLRCGTVARSALGVIAQSEDGELAALARAATGRVDSGGS